MLHLERTAAAANGHHLDGVLADNQHTLGVGQVNGQDIALVLQQHDTVLGNLQGGIIVRLAAQVTLGTLVAHGRAKEQTQHAAHLLIELARREFAFLDELFVGQCHVVSVIGVAGAPC